MAWQRPPAVYICSGVKKSVSHLSWLTCLGVAPCTSAADFDVGAANDGVTGNYLGDVWLIEPGQDPASGGVVCTFTSQTWIGSIPGRGGHGMVIDNNIIYVFGGTTTGT